MNNQNLKEYIRKRVFQEAETMYVGKDPDKKSKAKEKINKSSIPSSAKKTLSKQIDQNTDEDYMVTLEEESKHIRDALSKTYMYIDAISDTLSGVNENDPRVIKFKKQIDDFNDNTLKPIFRQIVSPFK